MKKLMTIVIAAFMVLSLVACTAQAPENSGVPATSDAGTVETVPQSGLNAANDIDIVSREEGSGTRGAFIELFGVEQKDANGEKVDYTTEEAAITNNTSVMLTTVAGDAYAIGYISLGSLNDTVKALEIDGAVPSVENIQSDTYKISRPFNIATKGNVSEAAQDFINYILSAEGQAVISANGYIGSNNAPAFAGGTMSGKVVVAGSSSVSPVRPAARRPASSAPTRSRSDPLWRCGNAGVS
jgi:phosphate transport system substrate-binding protein